MLAEDAPCTMTDYIYDCHSPAKYPVPWPKRKTAPKKEKTEKKKAKKVKQESLEGSIQHTLDDWLGKGIKESTVRFNDKVLVKTIEAKSETFTTVPLKGILKKQPSPISKNVRRQVSFQFEVEAWTLLKHGGLSKGKKILDLTWEGDYAKRQSFHGETSTTKGSHETETFLEMTRSHSQTSANSESHTDHHA